MWLPGSFTGYAFDACQAPDQEAMDAWLERSPYWGIGIYTSGVNRYCDVQENLSADWVAEQDGKVLVMLPGPPNELQPMFTEQVVPRLAERGLKYVKSQD